MSKILKSFGMAALLVALLAGTGMAGTNDAVVVTGTLSDTYTITAPENFGFGTFAIGNNNVTDKTVTVATTYSVALQAAGSAGSVDPLPCRMTNGVTDLAHPMYLIATAGETIALGTSAANLKTGITQGSTGVTVAFGQYVKPTDTVSATAYSMTVTFSAV